MVDAVVSQIYVPKGDLEVTIFSLSLNLRTQRVFGFENKHKIQKYEIHDRNLT